MPNYDYKCANCGHEEEVFQKITDPSLEKCPKCNQPSFKRKPGGGIGLQFRGSGFYINDYDTKRSSEDKPSSGKCGCGKSSCDA